MPTKDPIAQAYSPAALSAVEDCLTRGRQIASFVARVPYRDSHDFRPWDRRCRYCELNQIVVDAQQIWCSGAPNRRGLNRYEAWQRAEGYRAD